MPLRDHFRSPVWEQASWEGFHGLWPGNHGSRSELRGDVPSAEARLIGLEDLHAPARPLSRPAEPAQALGIVSHDLGQRPGRPPEPGSVASRLLVTALVALIRPFRLAAVVLRPRRLLALLLGFGLARRHRITSGLSTLPAFYVVVRTSRRYHAWWKHTTPERRRSQYLGVVLTDAWHAGEVRLFGLAGFFRRAYGELRS